MQDGKYFSSSEITRKLDISLRQLYYWELKGIVKPHLITMGSREFKRYSNKDFEILQTIKYYLDQGYTLSSAVQKANKLNI
ncbi:MerR family transcriptional regulator [candidate division KSB1 bacterium]|nr:MerR family transcriptional regulator [candidate division KSB1 bacterium]